MDLMPNEPTLTLSTYAKRTAFAGLIWIGICFGIAAAAAWVTQYSDPAWYAHLEKPFFNPPPWLFGPVWLVLYTLIGISGGLLWQHRTKIPAAFYSYLLQLVFNLAWSFIFFGAHQIGWALVDMLLLLTCITLTIKFAYRHHPYVAGLLVPYLIWIVFATLLNASVWFLN